MIAENKAEFFEQLERELEKLGVEDTAELMADLEWHFAEGELRGVPESETCRELGSIAEIARSCLDLKSEAINSMVARDVTRKKGVSLTKPGRSVPADPSLAGKSAPEPPIDDGAGLPSYTPEHNSSEVYPNAAQNSSPNSPFGSSGAAGSADNATGSTSGAAGSADSSSSTDNAGSASATGSAGNAAGSANGGRFEKVGKAMDGAFNKAGKAINDAFGKAENAVNGALGSAGSAMNDALKKAGSAVGAFRPSDSYREHVNNSRNGGEIPKQFTKAKTGGGSQFIDTSNLKPNVNTTQLVIEILLDVFLWVWLIPLMFSAVIAFFGLAVMALDHGIQCFRAVGIFRQFKFVTRMLFAFGFWNAIVVVICAGIYLFRLPIALVKAVIKRHIKAIYDI